MRSIILSAVSTAALLLAAGQALAAPPPAAFGALPAIQAARISPDGKSIAILGAQDGQHYISIAGIDDGKAITLPLGSVDAFDLHWAGDGQMIMDASVLVHPPGADPKLNYHYKRSIIISRDGKVVGQLLANNPVFALVTALPIVGYVDGDHPQVIVRGVEQTAQSMLPTSDTRFKSKVGDIAPALFRVDAATGNGKLMERGDGSTDSWSVDLQGEPRVRWGRDPITHDFRVETHGKGKSTWTEVYRAARHGDEMQYLGYSDPEDAIYYITNTDHGGRIAKRTLSDGKETIVSDKTTGPSLGVIWDPWRKSAVAIYSEVDRDNYEWLDPELGDVFTALSKAFKNQQVTLVNWSRDRTKIIVEVEADNAPPVWYLFDKTQHSVSPVAEEYPALKDAALGSKTWTTYKAADGLMIPAYITYPPGVTAETASKLPLIVMPHGGPADRDLVGFDYWAQFVASRGYVVLQPQFRGSSGFGLTFEHAGDREWGGKMQTDLLDGVAMLAAKGQIDPARVCIVGWSYGGYAALEAATAHPEAYKCAVSVNGVSDLQMLMGQEHQAYGAEGSEDLYNQLGYASDNREQLGAYSPAQHVENVRGPVLLFAGQDDTVVNFQQSVHMQKALESAGKDVQLVSFKGDDHYLHTSADRTAMLEALDAFLAKNLPVK